MSVAYRSTCQPTLGRYIDRDVSTCRPTHLDRHIGRESVDISTDISVEHRSICRPTVDRYVGRHIGRGVRKLHMILFLFLYFFHSIFKWRRKEPISEKSPIARERIYNHCKIFLDSWEEELAETRCNGLILTKVKTSQGILVKNRQSVTTRRHC